MNNTNGRVRHDPAPPKEQLRFVRDHLGGEFIERNGVVSVRCPAHEDQSPSLDLQVKGDTFLLCCRAGCDSDAVLKAAGLTWSKIFAAGGMVHEENGASRNGTNSHAKQRPSLGKIVAEYDYLDEQGRLLFQAIRYDPKAFRQRRPDPNNPRRPIWDLQGVRRVPYHLPDLLKVPAGGTIYVCEGEKDCDNLRNLGLTATTCPQGAGKWGKIDGEAVRIAFAGKRIVILPDHDTVGENHAADVARRLHGIAAEVRIVRLPNLPDKGDVSDWLDAAGTLKNLQLLIDRVSPWEPQSEHEGQASNADGRPIIALTTEEHEVVAATIKAIAAGDKEIFQRGGRLVSIHRDSRPSGSGKVRRPASTPRIVPIPLPSLRIRLVRVAQFWRKYADGHTGPAHPPDWLVKAIDSAGVWPGVRPLEAMTETPILRGDGTVLQTAGYDEETRVVYIPSGEFPAVPDLPTAEQVAIAREAILEAVHDFPFRSPADRAAWVAALLTLIARFGFDGPSPLFLIEANIRGAGKGKLAWLIVVIGTGREPAVSTYTDDEREMRKIITAIALQGDRVILFDNVSGEMGDPSLAAALTSTEWSGRVLGRSEQPRMPLLVTWLATGNNLTLICDIPRRTLRVRIESPAEKPEDRDGFRHPDLGAWTKKERGRLLVAALTILRGYVAAGRPDMSLRPWGSFEGWSAMVRAAVVWCGLPDPRSAREIAGREDPETELLRAFLAGWQELDRSGGRTVAEVLDELKANPGAFATLRNALSEAFSLRPGDLPGSRAIAKKLSAWEGRNVGGLCFSKRMAHGGAMRWSVRTIADDPRQGGIGGSGDCSAQPPAWKNGNSEGVNIGGGVAQGTHQTHRTHHSGSSDDTFAFDEMPEIREDSGLL